MRLLVAAALATSLTGCATSKPYVRTDGAPVDTAQQQAVLAQCKGEAVQADILNTNVQRNAAIAEACMARNGYIHPQR
jgi:hypothetical protein